VRPSNTDTPAIANRVSSPGRRRPSAAILLLAVGGTLTSDAVALYALTRTSFRMRHSASGVLLDTFSQIPATCLDQPSDRLPS
jgi:hypothetical protein